MTDPQVTCSVCGQAPSADTPLLSWSRDTASDGGPTWLCPNCTRENVRGIEAKLDPQWW